MGTSPPKHSDLPLPSCQGNPSKGQFQYSFSPAVPLVKPPRTKRCAKIKDGCVPEHGAFPPKLPIASHYGIVNMLIHTRFGAYIYIYPLWPRCLPQVVWRCFRHFSQTNKTIWRKFRSQTSDTLDRWKSRGGKSQRRERISRKKMQVREKVEKSRNTVFYNVLWLRRVEKYAR